MKQILSLLSLLFLAQLHAQSNYNASSFEVTIGDLKSTICEIDSTANAFVIFEKGYSYIDKSSFKLTTEFQFKVKILNKNNTYPIEIFFQNNDENLKFEEVRNIKASTYNLENNKIVETRLNEENIYEEIYDENNKIIKFTHPNVQSGSVITYSYNIVSPFIVNFRGWNFQGDFPKLHSEYKASIPGNYEYSTRLFGSLPFSKNESELRKKCLLAHRGVRGMGTVSVASADCLDSVYIMENIPAFIDEDFMSSRKNYLSRIEYELKNINHFDGRMEKLTRTWKSTDRELRNYFSLGRQTKKKDVVRDVLPESISSINNNLDRAKYIFEFVQKNYSWNGEYLAFHNATIREIVKNETGNVAQLNLLLHNLLTESNIESTPILLSSRENGFATKLFPIISDFDYLIVQVNIDGTKYFLDATDKYLSFGQLPLRALNDYGRLLDFKKGSSWIDIPNDISSSIQQQVNIKIINENEVVGTINSRYTDYFAIDRKKDYFYSPDDYIIKFEKDYSNIAIIKHEVKDKNINSDKFEEYFEFKYLNSNNLTIYLDPFITKFFSSNPFKLQQRTYPVDFGYKMVYLYNLQLDLGDNYELIEIPQSKKMTLPEDTGSYTLAVNSTSNKINISLKINLKQSRFTPEFYPPLKEFMESIVKTQTKTLIVLKRKQ